MKRYASAAMFAAIFVALMTAAVSLYAPEEKQKSKGKERGEMDRLEAFLRDFEPGAIDEIRELKREHPDRYERFVREKLEWMRYMEELKREKPRVYELTLKDHKVEREIDELCEAYRKAESASRKEEIKKKLESAVRQRLEVKIKLLTHEIEMLKKELERQEKTLGSWKKNKDSFVQKKLKELTGEFEEEEEPF